MVTRQPLHYEELLDFIWVYKSNFMPDKDKNVTLSEAIGYSFMLLTVVSIAKAHSLESWYSQYWWCRITKQPATIMFCNCLGEVFKDSPTSKQIQTRPVTGGSNLGEQRQTLQQINYKYLVKQRSESIVVDIMLGSIQGATSMVHPHSPLPRTVREFDSPVTLLCSASFLTWPFLH